MGHAADRHARLLTRAVCSTLFGNSEPAIYNLSFAYTRSRNSITRVYTSNFHRCPFQTDNYAILHTLVLGKLYEFGANNVLFSSCQRRAPPRRPSRDVLLIFLLVSLRESSRLCSRQFISPRRRFFNQTFYIAYDTSRRSRYVIYTRPDCVKVA